MNALEHAARQAQDRQELRADADLRQLAFELEAALLSANWYFHLFKDATYLDRARRAVRARLASEATPAGLHLVPDPQSQVGAAQPEPPRRPGTRPDDLPGWPVAARGPGGVEER
jgi:hypothetical protein